MRNLFIAISIAVLAAFLATNAEAGLVEDLRSGVSDIKATSEHGAVTGLISYFRQIKHAPDYKAIAYSGRYTRTIFGNWDASSAESAIKQVLKQCEEETGSRCTVYAVGYSIVEGYTQKELADVIEAYNAKVSGKKKTVIDAKNEEKTRLEYAKALREIQPLADQGDAPAQYQLGHMYDKGQGVPKDFTEAVKWYRKAAEQGHADAQSSLGSMYFMGLSVPRDFVQAHMWISLAASQGNEIATSSRTILAGMMTPSQIAEAEKLAREWRPK